MSNAEHQAANRLAPVLGQIGAVAITTSSARTDLSAAAQLSTLAESGEFFTFIADGGDVYFAFNNADSGSVDETASTGATRCSVLKDGAAQDYRLVKGYTWLVAKGSAACKLRIHLSSAPTAEGVGL